MLGYCRRAYCHLGAKTKDSAEMGTPLVRPVVNPGFTDLLRRIDQRPIDDRTAEVLQVR
jgi:hypothetical protein